MAPKEYNEPINIPLINNHGFNNEAKQIAIMIKARILLSNNI